MFSFARASHARPAVLAAAAFALATPATLRAQASAPAVALGSPAIGASTTGTVTFTFSASTTVSSISVVTQGTAGLDFTLNTAAPGTCTTTTYATNATCTVGVKFTPLAAGPRAGAVLLLDASSNKLAVGLLSGSGAGAAFVTSTLGAPTSLIANAYPTAVFVDAAGNVYTTSVANETNQKVTPAGVITTVTGSAKYPVGIVVDGAGYAYVADNCNEVIYKVDQVTGTTTNFASGFSLIRGIAIDALGNIYAADSNAQAVDEITPAGVMTTLLTPSNAPYAISVDTAGNVYWAATAAGYIYKYNPSTAATTTVNSGATINNPNALWVDTAGNVYVTNQTANLYRIAPGATTATVIATTGTSAINGVAADAVGNLYYGNVALYKSDRTHLTVTAPGATAVGSHSSELTTTYVNNGSGPSAITGSSTAGPAVAGPSTTCTASNSIAVLATCVVGIEFAPTAHGSPQTGTLSLTGAVTSPVLTVPGDVVGDPTQLGFSTPPPANLTAGGNAGTVTVQVQDNGGTLVTGQTTSITLNITGPASYSKTYTQAAVNGATSFNLSSVALTTSGTYTYAASASGLTGASTMEGVSPAATTRFTVTPASTRLNAGATDSITVTAYDSYNNVATNYTGTVKLSSTDTAAVLPANFTLTSGTATTSVTFITAGTQTVTATDTVTSSVTGPSASITVKAVPVYLATAVPVYMVTSGGDDGTAVAANCNDISMGDTAKAGCYLRDAFAAVTALDYTSTAVPAIIFNSTLYGTTITLTTAISVTGNVALTGPAAPNTITLSGGGTVGFLTQSAAAITQLTNLIFTNFKKSNGAVLNATVSGNVTSLTDDQFLVNTAPGSGGGAVSSAGGTLTITGCTFSGNSAGLYLGGALYANSDNAVNIYTSTFGGIGTAGTTTGGNTAAEGGAVYLYDSASNIYDSLFVGNYTATGGSGGAVYTNVGTSTFYDTTFTLNVANSTATSGNGGAFYQLNSALNYFYNVTVTNNTAHYRGGGVYEASGSLYAYDSIIEGNSSQLSSYADVYSYTSALSASTGTLYNISSSATTNPMLSALANYGGPTLSILPLPGSPALRYASCYYTGGETTDQRGYPRVLNGACGGSGVSIDAGATQSSYALAFVQQPSNGVAGGNLNPAPTVQVYESGVPLNATPPTGGTVGTLKLTNSAGTPTTLTGLLANSGLETITAKFPSNQTAETLTASLQTGATTPVTIASVTSTPFNIISNYIWLVDNSGALNKITESGTASGSTAATSGTASLGGIAFDAAGNNWSVTSADNALAFTNLAQTTSTTYTGGGLNTPVSIAVDGAGYIWVANQANNSISQFSNAGTAITPTTGYYGTTPSDFATPSSIVLDTTGGIWVTNKTGNSVTHVFGAAIPVTTPLSQAVSTSTLGTKP